MFEIWAAMVRIARQNLTFSANLGSALLGLTSRILAIPSGRARSRPVREPKHDLIDVNSASRSELPALEQVECLSADDPPHGSGLANKSLPLAEGFPSESLSARITTPHLDVLSAELAPNDSSVENSIDVASASYGPSLELDSTTNAHTQITAREASSAGPHPSEQREPAATANPDSQDLQDPTRSANGSAPLTPSVLLEVSSSSTSSELAEEIDVFLRNCQTRGYGTALDRRSDYYDWNAALAAYIVRTGTRGIPFFFDVHGSALQSAATGRLCPPQSGDWEDEFLSAVRRHILTDSSAVELGNLRGHYAGVPRCLSWLASTILAAYYMTPDDTSSTNFFRHFNARLGLPPDAGRPPGMQTEYDRMFWKTFNDWIAYLGLIPTATSGLGAYKFTHYPISQCLLREADVLWITQRLKQQPELLRESGRIIFLALHHDLAETNVHLRELLADPGPRRERLELRLQELAKNTTLGPPTWNSQAKVNSPDRAVAGIHRSFDFRSRKPRYFLLVPSKDVGGDTLSLSTGDEVVTSNLDMPGWFIPSIQLRSLDLDDGRQFKVMDPPQLRSVDLPKRQFWILTRDPDDPDSDRYASWSGPPAGTDFFLLCRGSLQGDLETLKREEFLSWESVRTPFDGLDWLEFEGCLVRSLSLKYSDVNNAELLRALTPVSRVALSVVGGVRVRGQDRWIADFGPRLCVQGFEKSATVVVDAVSTGRCILRCSVASGSSIPFPTTDPGTYIVTLGEAEGPARRVELTALGDIALGLPDPGVFTSLNGHRIVGPLVLDSGVP
jgi:hypothetical protein